MKRCKITLFGAFFFFLANVALSQGGYTIEQVTSGAVNHRAPGINNLGEIVWMQETAQGWQVFSSTRGQLTSPSGNFTEAQYPTIADDGSFVCFRPGSLPCTGSGFLIRYPGESTIEFCSRNGASHRDPIPQSGISSSGANVIWGRKFFDTFGGLSSVRFFVNGAQVSPGTVVNWNNPAINSSGEYVYDEFGQIFSSARVLSLSGTQPSINDRGDVAYVSGSQINVLLASFENVNVGVGADPSINRDGVVVFERQVGGRYQIFRATPPPNIDVAVTKVEWSLCGANALVTYRIQGGEIPSAQNVVLEVYWARGPNLADRISPAGTNPRRLIQGAPNLYVVNFSGLGVPPADATHLLALADADSVLNDSPDGNDVFAVSLIDLGAIFPLVFNDTSGLDFRYEIGHDLPPGVAPIAAVYWSDSDRLESRIEPAIFTTLIASSRGCYGPINIPGPLINARPLAASHLLLVLDPQNVLTEENEANNVTALLVPIAPTVEILAPETALKSHRTNPGDRHPYSVAVRVVNNDPVSTISVSIDWAEVYFSPKPVEDPKTGVFSVTVAPGTTETISLGNFEHTWQWIDQDFPVFDSEEKLELAADILAGASTEVLEVLEDIAGGVGLIADVAGVFMDRAEARGEAIPTLNVEYRVLVKYGPTLTLRKNVTLEVGENFQEHFANFVSHVWISSAATDVGVELLFSPFALASIPAFLAEVAGLLSAQREHELALDPPDPNFTEIVVPNLLAVPELAEQEASIWKDYATAYLELFSMLEAKAISLNRADGARGAGRPDWEAAQLTAAARFAQEEALVQMRLLLIQNKLAPLIQELTMLHGEKVIPYLEEHGLPEIEKKYLRLFGWTEDNLESLRKNLINVGMRPVQNPAMATTAMQVSALFAVETAKSAQTESVKIRIERLGQLVRSLTVSERASLVNQAALIKAGISGGFARPDLLDQIKSFIADVNRLLEESNNLSELAEFQNSGIAFLAAYQQLDVEPSDTTAPAVECPPAATVGVGANCQAAVPDVLPNVTASDNITPAGSLMLAQRPAAGTLVGPSGTNITVTATDAAGNSGSCTMTLRVVDTTPPVIATLMATPNVLWPPDHKMVPVTLTVSATDNCGPTTCKIISVSSNEPSEGLGDGDMPSDWQITDDFALLLRAERSAKGSGRTYTITVQCSDSAGNTVTKTVSASVPRDQREK